MASDLHICTVGYTCTLSHTHTLWDAHAYMHTQAQIFFFFLIKKIVWEARKMAQGLRALPVLPEDPASVPYTHMAANMSITPALGDLIHIGRKDTLGRNFPLHSGFLTSSSVFYFVRSFFGIPPPQLFILK